MQHECRKTENESRFSAHKEVQEGDIGETPALCRRRTVEKEISCPSPRADTHRMTYKSISSKDSPPIDTEDPTRSGASLRSASLMTHSFDDGCMGVELEGTRAAVEIRTYVSTSVCCVLMGW